jgi:hypothetical protein
MMGPVALMAGKPFRGKNRIGGRTEALPLFFSWNQKEPLSSDPDALIIFRANPVHAARTLFRLNELGCNHSSSTAGAQLARELACLITEAGASCLTDLFLCHRRVLLSHNSNECQARKYRKSAIESTRTDHEDVSRSSGRDASNPSGRRVPDILVHLELKADL